MKDNPVSHSYLNTQEKFLKCFYPAHTKTAKNVRVTGGKEKNSDH